MLRFFKKAANSEKNVIASAVSSGAHKNGVLVCGDPGQGSSLISQLVIKEITKEKIKSKFFISCYSAEDFSHLTQSKKLTSFTIKEENLDFNFQALTPNSLNKEKIDAFVSLVVHTLGLYNKEKAFNAVQENMDYFNYFDLDLLKKSLSGFEGFSEFNWNYLIRENDNSLNVFDGLSEKLSQYDAIFLEIDSFNTNPIAYAIMNYVKLLHSSLVFVVDSNQPIEEEYLKNTYSHEAVIVRKDHPSQQEVNWFNMVGLTKSMVNDFDFAPKTAIQSYNLGHGALFVRDKNLYSPVKWKISE